MHFKPFTVILNVGLFNPLLIFWEQVTLLLSLGEADFGLFESPLPFGFTFMPVFTDFGLDFFLGLPLMCLILSVASSLLLLSCLSSIIHTGFSGPFTGSLGLGMVHKSMSISVSLYNFIVAGLNVVPLGKMCNVVIVSVYFLISVIHVQGQCQHCLTKNLP